MSTRLSDLLHDLASEMPVEVEGSTRRVAHRARTRRLATALLASGTAAAVIVGGVFVLRTVSPAEGTGSQNVLPAASSGSQANPPETAPGGAFAGLWPETTPEALAAEQAQVDDGHQPWRVDPAMTAQALAADLLGWAPADVQVESQDVQGDQASIALSNRLFGDPVPPISVELRRLGRTGSEGVWSVVSVSSSLIELFPIATQTDGSLLVSGQLADVLFDPSSIDPSWAPSDVRVDVDGGPTLDSRIGGGTLSLVRRFEGSWPVPAGTGSMVVWVRVEDATGRALGATASVVLPSAQTQSVTSSIQTDSTTQALPGAWAQASLDVADPKHPARFLGNGNWALWNPNDREYDVVSRVDLSNAANVAYPEQQIPVRFGFSGGDYSAKGPNAKAMAAWQELLHPEIATFRTAYEAYVQRQTDLNNALPGDGAIQPFQDWLRSVSTRGPDGEYVPTAWFYASQPGGYYDPNATGGYAYVPGGGPTFDPSAQPTG